MGCLKLTYEPEFCFSLAQDQEKPLARGKKRLSTYKKKFSAKELQDELELNVYDYGWRNYDPANGRFLKIDRFSEKYHNLSNYSYSANNPVYFMDIQGDSIKVNNATMFNKDMNSVYGKDTNYYDVNKSGDVSLSPSGIGALIESSARGFHDDTFVSLTSINNIIKSDVTTEIIYSNDVVKGTDGSSLQAEHASDGSKSSGVKPSDTGGEFTLTIADNPDRTKNSVYISTDSTHSNTVRTGIKDNPTVQEALSGNIYNTKTYSNPRENSVMHGLGHVLNPGSDQQSGVVKFDNVNRRLNKTPANTDPDKTHQ
jgi:RHS repeat-associated protein